MRFYYYKGDNKKEIKKIDRDNIAEDIVQKARCWHDDIERCEIDFKRIQEEIFPDTSDISEVKLIPDVYEQAQTYKANIFKSTYQNADGMFDVEGQDVRSHNLAATYKASLVYDFDRIKLTATLDEMLDDWVYKGEAAAFVYWDKTVKRERQQQEQPILDEMGNLIGTEVINVMADVVVNSNANVKRLDPLNLFFDKTMRRDWCSCGKIIREFIPLEKVLANTQWKLTPDEIKELKETVYPNGTEHINNIDEEKLDIDKHIVGNTVEVLEYYGDYVIPEKYDVAKNVIITVIAGKYVAQIAESEYPMCPIIFATYNERPDTLRGQSPMKPTLFLNELENRCCDLNLHCWHLTANPAMLAPKGMINRDQKMKPGAPYEYNATSFSNLPAPRPLDFSAGIKGFDFQDYFKKKMEGATGVTPYMQGAVSGPVRTASESTYIYSGQTTRLSYDAHQFNYYVILPIVETFSELKKTFEEGNQSVPTKEGGCLRFLQVDDEVRNGNYTFIMGTAQTSVEREQYVRRIFELLSAPSFQGIVGRPEFPASEFFKWVLNEVGYRQIDTLTTALGLNEKIAQVGRDIGIQEKNMGGFVNDMGNLINENIPEFADILQEQLQDGQIPNPKDMVSDIKQENIV